MEAGSRPGPCPRRRVAFRLHDSASSSSFSSSSSVLVLGEERVRRASAMVCGRFAGSAWSMTARKRVDLSRWASLTLSKPSRGRHVERVQSRGPRSRLEHPVRRQIESKSAGKEKASRDRNEVNDAERPAVEGRARDEEVLLVHLRRHARKRMVPSRRMEHPRAECTRSRGPWRRWRGRCTLLLQVDHIAKGLPFLFSRHSDHVEGLSGLGNHTCIDVHPLFQGTKRG